MWNSIRFVLVLLVAGSLSAVYGLAQPEGKAKGDKKLDPNPAVVLPAKLSGFSDSGLFHFYVNEEMLIRIQFTWKEDGSFDNKSVMELAGQKIAMSTTVTPDKDGCWKTIVGTSREGKFHLERMADKVKRTLVDKTDTFALKSGTVLFESFAPALMSLSVRAYDTAKGRKQSIPMMVIPDGMVNATIERKDTVERNIAGKDLKLTRYLLTLARVDISVWADSAGALSMEACYLFPFFATRPL
jgi:hypothetical protein